ncbi:MoaD/ThiS family protein [Aquibaculum arenosum]|uniref:MoaD/ThiS family protein n=1 Tax=Aquibaculum arenosum TaxID=3032591 RepID=A0ABT5YQF6_9PROT|nr:MoaD/ThiS family protein [Fodinicurvata sp. CAU 1616]MDF2097205.1 MoaD/ThiS family protein [Fodinicurvata sp. CAU 1616]
MSLKTEREAPQVVVHLPTALRALFPEAPPRVQVRAATLAEVMHVLDQRWPGMRDRLCDSRPALRRHINAFVDGERVDLTRRLQEGDEVILLTAISGG